MSQERCESCKLKLHEFLNIVRNEDELMDFLNCHCVIPRDKSCTKCGSAMKLDKEKNVFRCTNRISTSKKNKRMFKVCGNKISQFKNTWFHKHHITKEKICMLVAYWCFLRHPRQQFLMNELEVSAETIVDWSSYLREVCENRLVKKSEMLGGDGVVVQIDEAKIGKRKYNRGRILQGEWVFGGIEPATKKVFIEAVPNRGAATLLDVIKRHILPKTTIMSDCWKSYNCLEHEGFRHLTVNHSYNFVDPDTGAHIQSIERVWREVRAHVPRFGRRKHHFSSHISEFLYRCTWTSFDTRIHEIFSDIGKLYGGERNNVDEPKPSTSKE